VVLPHGFVGLAGGRPWRARPIAKA
jgi:hypothetical protein